jgi:quinoprotein glucose dehydrogenase
MNRLSSRSIVSVALLALIVGVATVSMRGQTPAAKVGEWPTYGADLASTRYSPLDQINATNFSKLQLAFKFRTESLGPRPEFQFQGTPLMVNGRLFITAGTRRAAVALSATTGELLWMHSIDEGKRGEAAPRQLSGRGLSYWTDGKEERIIYVTAGYQMVALDAKTGQRVAGFGTNGLVDLKQGLDQEGLDLTTAEIGLHAAPIISKDIIVIGAAHREGGAPRSKTNVKGYIRGFDVRTGKRVWIFHTIPMKGEFGYDTWDPDAAAYTGNAGVWAQMSADEELGIVYMPVELPTGDYYGGHRGGNKQGSPDTSLFSETLLALDIKTGQRKWHYQLVHHGVWDHDIPCAPILMDLVVDGKPVKAVAQPTKQNWLYVFDRVTGKPVWPIVEKPVEKGDVPGEWYSPTQPFVTKPDAYERQGVTIDDLINYTPELRAEAEKLVSLYKIGPIFTPPVVSKWEGPRGTLIIPEVTGGANWQGGSFDPETKRFYIFTNVAIASLGLAQPENNASDMLYVRGAARNPNPPATPAAGGAPGGGGGLNVRGLPLIKPPYATISAIDMNKGDLLWKIPHGDTPDNVKNNPALKGLTIPRTGRPGRIGVLTTKTLLIAGEGGFATTPDGRGAYLRAYDKATGADAGQVFMPAPQTGSPMTYSINGTQYIAVAVSGPGYAGELLVYKLAP